MTEGRKLELATFIITMQALAEDEYLTREPPPRQPYKSTLTKAEQKKRAKKNKAQKASRKRNR